MNTEDVTSKHPELSEFAQDECFSHFVEFINKAYYAGLNGGENRWSSSPSDYCKDGLIAEKCKLICLVWRRMRQAYFQGTSDREALKYG